jgi:Sugar efflux transporter for intercellular exchange
MARKSKPFRWVAGLAWGMASLLERLTLPASAWGIISAFVWLVYGLVHKDKVLIIINFLWVAFAFTVVIGVVVYK